MKKIFLLLAVFLLTATIMKSEELVMKTITEALNYTGDRDAVMRLVITDSISGSGYSPDSEWSEFFTLNETFSNLDEVEILTDQDIPNAEWVSELECFRGLFYMYKQDNWGYRYYYGADWLKRFSAPHIRLSGINPDQTGVQAFAYCRNLISVYLPEITYLGYEMFRECSNLINVVVPKLIYVGDSAFENCTGLKEINFLLLQQVGNSAFRGCTSLTIANFPKLTTVRFYAFRDCTSLTIANFPVLSSVYSCGFTDCTNLKIINFPRIRTLESYAFAGCTGLTTVSMGTYFQSQTKIEFESGVFAEVPTYLIDLTLGTYILPTPYLFANIWQDERGDGSKEPYYWKSITLTNGVAEKIEQKNILYIDKNIYCIDGDNIIDLILFDITGKQIKSFNKEEKIIDLNDDLLPMGIFFLKYYDIENKTTNIEKLIKN